MLEKLINIFKIINILIVFIFSLMFISDYYAKDEVLDSKYLYNSDAYNKVNISYNKLNYNNNSNNIVISIPKIKLNKKVVKANKNFSNLSNNLVYYNSFNSYNKNLIFGHSGLGFGTYFNRIDELNNNDLLYITKDNVKYTYLFKSKYIIDETDTFILNDEKNSKKLLLITCHKVHKNKRVVVEFNLKCTKNVEN